MLVWHSVILTSGSLAVYRALWSGPFRFLVAAILPMFFALSGFLVTGSLVRTRLHQFAALRVLRLVPALAVEVALSAMVLGSLFTTLPLRDYLTSPELGGYFGNILGLVHFTLPGVFEQNRVPRVVNSQLWTIPFELECYVSLAIVSLLMGLRHRRIFAALLVLFLLTATAGAVLNNSVSPFVPLQGRVLVAAFLAGVGDPSLSRPDPLLRRYRRRCARSRRSSRCRFPTPPISPRFRSLICPSGSASCDRRRFRSATCPMASTCSTSLSSKQSRISFLASGAGGR